MNDLNQGFDARDLDAALREAGREIRRAVEKFGERAFVEQVAAARLRGAKIPELNRA